MSCGLLQPTITSEIMNQFRDLVGLAGRDQSVTRPLHTQDSKHRKTRTNIHASGGIRTHDPSIQAVTTHALERAATGIGCKHHYAGKKYFQESGL